MRTHIRTVIFSDAMTKTSVCTSYSSLDRLHIAIIVIIENNRVVAFCTAFEFDSFYFCSLKVYV